MKGILQRLFEKRGIESIEQLDPAEKATFEGWEKVLSKETLTINDVQTFCRSQLGIIEAKWKDYSLEQSKKAELVPYFTVYKCILDAISAPLAAKQQLELHLQQLIDVK